MHVLWIVCRLQGGASAIVFAVIRALSETFQLVQGLVGPILR